jgi:hypothetical protein
MTVKANICRQYLIRMGIIAIAGIGFALYCVYDGAIGYPNQRIRALKYQEVKEICKNEKKTQSEWRAQWEKIATENGWSLKNPGEPKPENAWIGQYAMAGVTGFVGILFGFRVLLASRRWIAADEEGLSTHKGQQIPYDKIITFSKKKWRTKGIARVRYWQDERQKRLVLDDFKFDRSATEAIVRQIEAKITPEQIVDGKPEPPLQEPSQQDSTAENSETAS